MGIFDSIGDTWQLIKNSMSLTLKNKAIFAPTLRQIIIGLAVYVLMLFGLVAAFFTTGVLQFTFISFILFGFVFFLLIFPFIKFYYRAAQCWIVYKTFVGEKPDLSAGLNRARKNMGDIFGLTIADIILTHLANQLKHGSRGRGIGGIIIGAIMYMIGKIVEEAWDLIGNYLIPASIIPEQNLVESLKEIPKLKENIPGSLVGVFGIDFAGDAVKGYLGILFFLVIILGIIAVIIFQSLLILALVIFVFFVYLGVSFLVSIFIDMAKTIYFTTFYVTLTRRNEISVDYMGEIENYLKGQGAQSNAKQKQSVPTESKEEKLNKLLPYIEKYRRSKYSDEKIKEFLVKNNWPEDVVDEALKK